MMKLQILSTAACLAAASASGQSILTFNVSNAQGSGSFTADVAQSIPLPTGGHTYQSGVFGPLFPMDITDGAGNVLATINSVNAFSVDDNTATPNGDATALLNFVITAGSSDTTIEVLSSYVTTPTPYGPTPNVIANAAYTATDSNGDGVSVTGASTLTDFYVNGDVNTGTLFGSYGTGVTGGANASPSSSQSSGLITYGQSINSFQFASNFTVTANDQVSGNFSISVNSIPTPATGVLFAIGGLAAAGRRR